MLQAWVDGSGTGDSQYFVIAGYLATAERWAAFSERWKTILDLDDPPQLRMARFKMKDMSMKSVIDVERCRLFYGVIEDNVTAALSFSVKVPDLVRAVDNFRFPCGYRNAESLKNPYFWAFRGVIDELYLHQAGIGIDEPIDFFFDEEQEKNLCFKGWDELKRNAPPEKLKLLGERPEYRNDETCLPLQAADLFAAWVRRWELQGRGYEGLKELSFPWKTSKKITRIFTRFEEPFFTEYLTQTFK